MVAGKKWGGDKKTHIGIKGNEEADEETIKAIDMPGMTMIKLPYTDYYLTIRKA